MAAIAVLAVVFAATAVVLVSDDVSADTTKTEKIGEYEVVFETSMDATIVGDKITFSGYATAATVSGDASSYSGLFNQGDRSNKDVLDSYSAIYVKALSSCKIKQTNNALAEYDGQKGIVHDAATGAWTKTSENAGDYTSGYAFLIPKDNSDVTIEILDSNNKVLKKLTFDFDQVSTKIVLGSKVIKSDMGATPAWGYKNKTLTFTNYSGKEIFRTTEDLTIVLNGTNTISAYGAVNNYEGSAIYAGKALAISANDSADASLNVTQNTAGAYGIVSYSDKMTIGGTGNNVKKVTLTVDGKPNRAIYAVGGLTVNNATINAQSTEKTIRSNNAIAVGVNAVIDAKLVSLSGNSQGDDDYMGIKGASLSVGTNSTVTTQGLCLTGAKPFGDASNAIAGKVYVKGDYTQNPNTDLRPVTAGMYVAVPVSDVKAQKIDAVSTKDVDGKVYLVGNCGYYNVVVMAGETPVSAVTTNVTGAQDALTGKDSKANDVSLVLSDVTTGADITVPEGKTLTVVTNGNAFSGTISTGSSSANQTAIFDGVKGTFTITKGSVQITDGTITAGSITLDDETALVIDGITIPKDGTFEIKGTGNVVIKVGKTMSIGGTLTIGPNVTMEVYGKIVKLEGTSGGTAYEGKIVNNGKLVQMSGGVIDEKFTKSTSATLTGNNVSYTESDMKEIKVSGDTEKDLSFSEKQLVTVLDAGLNIYNKVTVAGKLVVPEGAKLTIMADGELVLKNSAELVIEGTLEIEEKDTSVATSVDGKLNVIKGTVTVSGSVVNNGVIAVGTDATGSTGVLTIAQDGVVTVGENGTIETGTLGKVVVDKSATLDVKGLVYGQIYNAGTVTIDSSAAATKATTVNQTADGAVVKVENYTVLASNANGLKITDAGMVLTTYRDSGETVEVTLPAAQKNIVELVPAVSWTGINNNEWKATISGVTVVSSVGTKALEDSVPNSVDNAEKGIYNNKQYSMTMDVSGTPGVSYKVKDDIVTTTAPSTGVSNTGTVTLTQAGTNAKMAVSGELALGDNVTLTVSGNISVTGTVTAGKDATITNNGTITVSKNGEVTRVNKTVDDTIKAALYETSETVSGSTVKTYHYVTLDAAIVKMNEAGVKNVVLKADQTVSADGKIPAEATLDLGGYKVTVSKDKTLTVASGATVKNGAEIIVNGTLFAEKKTDLKNITKITADVKSEELGEDGNVKKDGWVKYTSLANALAEAKSGETITLTGACELTADTVIPEGVTVVAGEYDITLNNGVKLTIDGVLKTDAKIIAQAAFGLTPMNKTGEYASTVIVNGKLMSSTKIVYGYSASSDNKDVANVTLAALSPVAGAYYEQGAYYVISSLAVAQKEIADITSKITVNGAVSAGDAAFVGTDDCTEIVIGETVAESIATNAKKIDTVLTVKSLTLSGMKLVIAGTTGYFTGSVAIGDASVSAVHANGFTFYEKDSKVYLGGTVEIADKGDSMTIAAGTVYTGENLAVNVNQTEKTALTIASGASFEVENQATVGRLVVDGTLTVPSTKAFTVDVMYVNGTVNVAASTGTAAEGTLTIDATTVPADATTGILYIGVSDSNLTGAAATFNGPVKFGTKATILVSAGASVDDAFTASLEDLQHTAVHVSDSIWFTAYSKAGTETVEISKVPVKNVELRGWTNENGAYASTTATSSIDGVSYDSGVWTVTIGKNTDLYADLNANIYKVVIKADEGIADVYLNGQAMAYGLVKESDGSYYYAYSATVAAGDYKVTYTLKNGWSGTATLYKAGTAQSGNAFSVSGNAGESDFTLSGVEKSGYVEPVTPSENKDDDGLTITDYLLIVLVVLIVIMAVIVAMRLMRS